MIFREPNGQHSFCEVPDDSRIDVRHFLKLDIADSNLVAQFNRRVEQEREQPLAIGVEDISARDVDSANEQ